MEDEELKKIRTSVYLRNLLPLNKQIVQSLPLDKIDLNKNQVFVCRRDAHKEIFCQILLNLGKLWQRRPSFEVVTLTDIIDKHFDKDHPSVGLFVAPDVLFICHALISLENKIYGPALDKIVEERKMYHKRTYMFYKGVVANYDALGADSMDEIVDLNGVSRTTHKKSEVQF